MFVAGFIGSPAMNFLPAKARGRHRVSHCSQAATIAAAHGAAPRPAPRVTLGIRPEHLHPSTPRRRCVSGPVEMVEQLGADTLVHIGHGAATIIARMPQQRARIAVGSTMHLTADPARVFLFDSATGRAPAMSGRSTPRTMAAERTLPAWPYPRLCAHRGAGKLAPENTLTAMRVGHAHGYAMVEFDVKLAADNVAFLLHDATLERTTSGRGRADALPWRELSRLDAGGWHSAKYAGEMLPTFAAIAPLGAGARRRSATSRSSPRPVASARPAPRWRSTPPRCGATPKCRRCCRRFPEAALEGAPRRRARRCRARCCWTSCRPTGSSASRASNASRWMRITGS